jgi:hypothetical protein
VLTVVVAMVLIIVCGTVLHGVPVQDAAAASRRIMPTNEIMGR